MIGETVTPRILKTFPCEIGRSQQPVDRQLQYSTAAQQFASDGPRSSSSVMELSHWNLLNAQISSDHFPHNFRRPRRNRERARIAIETACPMIVHVSKSAVDLKTLRDDVLGYLVAE